MKKKKLNITLGYWQRWPFKFAFHLDEKRIRTHKRVLGISGMGKSKALANMTSELILQGEPLLLLDPHEDLCTDVIQLLDNRGFFKNQKNKDKFMYIDFARKDRFVPFNYLAAPYDMFTIARNFVEVCTRVWPNLGDGGGPLFEQIMLAATTVLVQAKLPLTAMQELLTNKKFRDILLSHPLAPRQAIKFFTEEFDKWGRDQTQMIGSSMRRVFSLTFGDTLLYSLGQRDNLLDFRRFMDEGITVLVNLHTLDEETQKLIGCLIAVGMEQATISRTNVRTPYHFIIDEFASFSTKNGEAYAKFLSQARKFNVFLTVSHQHNSQLVKGADDTLLKAVGNIQTEVFFRLTDEDAEYEAPRLFRHNPFKTKHVVKGTKGPLNMEHHPVYEGIPEFVDQKRWALKDLWQQQAYVKYSRLIHPLFRKYFHPMKVRKIKTLSVQIKENAQRLEEIKEYYAQRFMRSVADIQPQHKQHIIPMLSATSVFHRSG